MIHIDGDDQLLVARVVGSAAVGLVGEIDMATEALLRDHLDAAAVQDPGGVKLDVSGVSFIDARGVSVLVHLSRQLAHAGAEVVLVDPSRSVRRVLEATHISPLFRIEEGRNLDFDE